jgi:hypothetical protein
MKPDKNKTRTRYYPNRNPTDQPSEPLPNRGGDIMRSFHQTPDKPQPFGFKIIWIALKTSDPLAVIDALELKAATPANWESGLPAAYEMDSWIFVSPPVSGWVLVVGNSLPYPTNQSHDDNGRKFDVMFARLMTRFDDVQLYGSHRVVDFATWARAFNGKPVRIFSWTGSEGAVLENVGEQTPEEAKLGMANISGLSPADAGDEIFRLAGEQIAEEEALVATGLSGREARKRVRQTSGSAFPDETDVVELAGLWSIDPSRFSEQDHPPSLGLVARLPEKLP